MFRIEDGRRYFYQWDTGRRIIIDINDSDIVEVHFSYGLDGEAIRKEIEEDGGTRFANVPDSLLQEYGRLRVYAYGEDHTQYYNEFEVRQRAKPDWYDYTEDKDSWTQLTGKVQDLERLTNYHSQLLSEKPPAEDNLLITDNDPIVVKEVPTYVAETAQISSMGCMTYRYQQADGTYRLDNTYAKQLLVTEQNLFDTNKIDEVHGLHSKYGINGTSPRDDWGEVIVTSLGSIAVKTKLSSQFGGHNVLLGTCVYLPAGTYYVTVDCKIDKDTPYNPTREDAEATTIDLRLVRERAVLRGKDPIDGDTISNKEELVVSGEDRRYMENYPNGTSEDESKYRSGGYVRIQQVFTVTIGDNYYLSAQARGRSSNKENCPVYFKAFCVSTIDYKNYMDNTVHYTKNLPTDFEDYGLGVSENYYNRLDYEHFAYINEVGQYQFDGTEEIEVVQTLADGSTAYRVTLPRHIELYSKSDPQYTLLSDKYAIRAKNNLGKLSAGEIMYGDTDNEVYIGSNAQNISTMKQEITGVKIVYARKVALVQYFSEDKFSSEFPVSRKVGEVPNRVVKIITSTPHDVPNTLEYLYKE